MRLNIVSWTCGSKRAWEVCGYAYACAWVSGAVTSILLAFRSLDRCIDRSLAVQPWIVCRVDRVGVQVHISM